MNSKLWEIPDINQKATVIQNLHNNKNNVLESVHSVKIHENSKLLQRKKE